MRRRPAAATIQALHFETVWIWLVERKSRTKDGEETMNLYGPKQLAESMRTVRKNTIQIAEDIPEKDYNYRPTPESRSVLETLVHIASLSALTGSSMKSSTCRRSKALTSGPCSRGKLKKSAYARRVTS